MSRGDQAFPGFGRCIYCQNTQGLTREHVIPFSLGGDIIISNASCESCRVIIHAFETDCAKKMYGPLRGSLNFPTRRKRERSKGLRVAVNRTHQIQVGYKSLPAVPLLIPRFPTPGILQRETETGFERSAWLDARKLKLNDQEQRMRSLADIGVQSFEIQWEFNAISFARMLAKIAHGWAVARYGIDAFSHMLPPYILGHRGDIGYLVGGGMHKFTNPPSVGRGSHLVAAGTRRIDSKIYVVSLIQLFREYDLPVYEVVVGEASRELVERRITSRTK